MCECGRDNFQNNISQVKASWKVSLLSQQSPLNDIVRMSAHTTCLIIIFSDIRFTLRVLLWRRDDVSAGDFDIWHEKRCHDQIFIYKICSFQADCVLASIKIYHCEAFTLHIRHCQRYICYYYWTLGQLLSFIVAPYKCDQ